MKRLIFSTIFLLTIVGFASAQTNKKNSKTISYISTSSHKAMRVKAKNSKSIEASGNSTSVVPDNRREYVKDGQLATETGHEAAPTNGEQFQSLKDSARRKTKKQ